MKSVFTPLPRTTLGLCLRRNHGYRAMPILEFPKLLLLPSPIHWIYCITALVSDHDNWPHFAKLQQEDYYRRKLEEGSNREILEELTGIPKAEMEAFMFYCKYSDAEIRTFNDYQFLVSLLDCYELYEREKERQEATKNYK